MTARYATLRKVLSLLVQPTHPCELCLLSGNFFIDPPRSGDPIEPPHPAAHRTATSLSRLPGDPDRLPVQNSTASRLHRTTPLAE